MRGLRRGKDGRRGRRVESEITKEGEIDNGQQAESVFAVVHTVDANAIGGVHPF